MSTTPVRGPASLRVTFGKWQCRVKARRYETNGNVYLGLVDIRKESSVADATINTGVVLPDTHVAIKNYTENEGMVEALLAAGVIEGEPTSHIPLNLFLHVPVYALAPAAYALVKQLAPFTKNAD